MYLFIDDSLPCSPPSYFLPKLGLFFKSATYFRSSASYFGLLITYFGSSTTYFTPPTFLPAHYLYCPVSFDPRSPTSLSLVDGSSFFCRRLLPSSPTSPPTVAGSSFFCCRLHLPLSPTASVYSCQFIWPPPIPVSSLFFRSFFHL